MGILPYMVIFCSILKQDPGKWCLTKLRLVGLTSLLSYLIMSSTDELARWSTFDIGVSQLMSHDDSQQEDQQFDDIDEFSQNIALNNRSPLKTGCKATTGHWKFTDDGAPPLTVMQYMDPCWLCKTAHHKNKLCSCKICSRSQRYK